MENTKNINLSPKDYQYKQVNKWFPQQSSLCVQLTIRCFKKEWKQYQSNQYLNLPMNLLPTLFFKIVINLLFNYLLCLHHLIPFKNLKVLITHLVSLLRKIQFNLEIPLRFQELLSYKLILLMAINRVWMRMGDI